MTAADLIQMLAALSYGDSRCGYVAPGAIKVFCPVCQPHGPRHDGDEPHLIVAVGAAGPEVSHQ